MSPLGASPRRVDRPHLCANRHILIAGPTEHYDYLAIWVGAEEFESTNTDDTFRAVRALEQERITHFESLFADERDSRNQNKASTLNKEGVRNCEQSSRHCE